MALLEPPDKAWDRVEELLEFALLLADRHDLDAFFASRLVGWGIKGNFGINASAQAFQDVVEEIRSDMVVQLGQVRLMGANGDLSAL